MIRTTLCKSVKKFGYIKYDIKGCYKEMAMRVLPAVRSKDFKSGKCLSYATNGSIYFPNSKVALGSIQIFSGDHQSTYGHAYAPETGEFHAWIEYRDTIIDFSLPEIIQTGLTERDDVGYFLIGRKPFILAGKAPYWIQYKRVEYIDDFLRRVQDVAV